MLARPNSSELIIRVFSTQPSSRTHSEQRSAGLQTVTLVSEQ